MTTAMTTTDTARGLAAFAGDSNPFLDDAQRVGADGAYYVGFSGNTGKWTFKGQELDAGTVLAFDLFNAQRGWIAWKNNKPVEKIMKPIIDINVNNPLPTEDQLDDHWDGLPADKRPKETDGWREVVTVIVRDLDGGPEMELTLPGSPGYRPINRLIKEFGGKVRMNMDENGFPKLPLVDIGSESFDSRGGKKYAPILTLTGWISKAELDGIEIVEPEVEPETAAPPPNAVQPATKPAVSTPRAPLRPTGKRVG